MSEVYFLGAMTNNGFSTEFGKTIADEGIFTYILKGGPGTGKSSLMKKAAKHFENICHCERYYCSSDPDSLDAVVFRDLGAAIVDGTSPHVFDPLVPGVNQKIVDLGECWDENKLKYNGKAIAEVTAANKSMLARAARFTGAVTNICSDTYQIGCECMLYKKLDSFASRFKRKILGKKGNGSGSKLIRQLTAVTEKGIMTMTETLEDYFDVYYVRDDYFAAANYLMSLLADEAVIRGYDVILCPCQLLNNTSYEHLLIPEQGVALVSESASGGRTEETKRLNLMRFYDKKLADQRKTRLKMNKAAVKDLTQEAVDTIICAKKIHDDIESYYISAMDHDKLNSVSEKLIDSIERNSVR